MFAPRTLPSMPTLDRLLGENNTDKEEIDEHDNMNCVNIGFLVFEIRLYQI